METLTLVSGKIARQMATGYMFGKMVFLFHSLFQGINMKESGEYV